jgi:hypothetical protein
MVIPSRAAAKDPHRDLHLVSIDAKKARRMAGFFVGEGVTTQLAPTWAFCYCFQSLK